jgi:branched-chain amino acid transport system substrate-binding protein
MKALHTIKNVCLVFSLQILLTGSLSDPHPDSYRDPQGGLNQLPHVGLKNDDSGFETGQGDVHSGESIRIGLLIQDINSVAAKQAAELAVRQANEKGGANGTPFQLVVRSMEGPWGTGSKQAVAMIFDENVVAILGSHDGRNAHLVEQVSAKSRVVFLSAWSGDPTLSQAFVPWFFNCVPNDIQQADALFEEIYLRRLLTDMVVVSDKSYDSQSALNNFLKNVAKQGKPEPLQLVFDSTDIDINDLIEKNISHKTSCVVLFVQPPSSAKIIRQIKLKYNNLPVFGSMELLNENHIQGKDLNDYEKVAFVSSANLSNRIGISFSDEYMKNYGTRPGIVAAYAFDGMNILIDAIRKAGIEREKLQKYITDIKYDGVTGTIQFDDKGNRKGIPGFVEIKNGIPVQLK